LTEIVLVTGATGFIGSALCRCLVEQGHSVRALHRPTSSLAALEGLPVNRIVGDVLAPETLRPALEGAGWVFHAAAQAAYWRHPEQVVQVAVEGTRNVMRAAWEAGVGRAVLTSSLAAMGVPAPGELLTEHNTFNLPPHRFAYGYAKRQAEIEALQVAAQGLEVVIVNPSVVLGPGDLNQISGSMVIEAARGKAVFWLEGGMNIVHIDDVVAGHLAAARRGRPGERYILAGENLSHRQVLTTLAEIVGRRPPLFEIPGWLVEPAARTMEILGRFVRLPLDASQLRLSRYYIYCDGSRSRQELALPDPRPFRQAAQEAYDWYREQGLI
jgi:dihydroflavonol-4-reductase